MTLIIRVINDTHKVLNWPEANIKLRDVFWKLFSHFEPWCHTIFEPADSGKCLLKALNCGICIKNGNTHDLRVVSESGSLSGKRMWLWPFSGWYLAQFLFKSYKSLSNAVSFVFSYVKVLKYWKRCILFPK